MNYKLETRITINAPIENVWMTFMNFEEHDKWNHFLRIPVGNKHVGDRINVAFLSEGDVKMTMKPTIARIEENSAFEWIGHLGPKGIFDGHHQFRFVDLGNNQTEFIHAEDFSGLLVRFVRKSVIEPTEIQFNIFNENFKSFVESNT